MNDLATNVVGGILAVVAVLAHAWILFRFADFRGERRYAIQYKKETGKPHPLRGCGFVFLGAAVYVGVAGIFVYFVAGADTIGDTWMMAGSTSLSMIAAYFFLAYR